ncbi:MAG: dethiobiotin synthase [Candidatus Omnitrophica bacterium]|nr:dethiobiotin synthase [Candidatus Omnitrophota bacterium]
MPRRINAIFIAGTGTGVGKTVITGLLARYAKEKNYRAITQKWVQTGTLHTQDFDRHLKLMNVQKGEVKKYVPAAVCYRFKHASSPHLAAALAKKQVSSALIVRSFNSLAKKFDMVIVEGVGGALVPLNRKNLVIDIVKKLKLPVVVVAQNSLGAINHTLLTIEALRARKIKILGIIFNNTDNNVDAQVAGDNPGIIKALSKERILGSLGFNKDDNALYKKFKPIAAKVIKAIP